MAEVRVTSIPALVELDPEPSARVTSLLTLVEMGPRSIHVTSMLVLVEMEPSSGPCEPRAGYFYNGINITFYCNELDLQTVGRELEATHFGSESEEAESGMASHSIRLGGDWSQSIDDTLGRDAIAGTRRTGVATFDDCVTQSRFEWSGAYLTSWQVYTVASGKVGWRAVLRHDGAPSRTIALL